MNGESSFPVGIHFFKTAADDLETDLRDAYGIYPGERAERR